MRQTAPRAPAAILSAVIALGVAGIDTAKATTAIRLDIDGLVRMSTFVIAGHVVEQHSRIAVSGNGSAERPFGKSVVTQTSIAVDEVLHGRFDPPVVHLSQLGGMATEQDARFVQRIFGYARFEVGERVIVFIEMAESGRLVVAGLAQGKYTVSSDGQTGRMVARRDLGELRLVTPGEHPMADAHSSSELDVLPLDRLRRLVAEGGARIRESRLPRRLRPTRSVRHFESAIGGVEAHR